MTRALGLAGLLGGLFWVALAFFPPEEEIFRNRLWTVALLGMLLGLTGMYVRLRFALSTVGTIAFVVLLAGLALMTLGSLLEYWVLSDLPHQGPGSFTRGLAWMTFLLGTLLLVVATTVVGSAMLHAVVAPRWLGLLFLLLLPLTIGLALVYKSCAALPIGSLSAAGLWVPKTRPDL